MKVLVTGNEGYIGSVLTNKLEQLGHEVVGLDIGYYSECLISNINEKYKKIKKDIRDIDAEDLNQIDAIIHLAALSNDPLGEFKPSLTEEINFSATLKIAKLAKKKGIHRFIYVSSQSMYGIAKEGKELDEDMSEKNPLTAYAKTKWLAEIELKKICSNDFTVVCFRPSTVFGASPRLRCDIVYNSLVACAYTTGKIEILSDGSPWRPVIHVKDLCKAFISGIEAPKELVSGQSFNVGIKNGNFTVKNLAEAAQSVVTGSELVFLNQHTDPRTYKVSFKKILTTLKDYFKPDWSLDRGGHELVSFFKDINFSENDFRNEKVNRLKKLESLIQKKKINNKLEWIL